MERRYVIIVIAVLAVIAVAVGLRSALNPYRTRQAALQADLAQIKPVEVKLQTKQANFARWKQAIGAKPAVWQELIPAPPPPPPPPPKPPNTKEKIAGLKVTRQGIGDKVRIMSKENPKGVFLGPGDSINGMKIKEVTKTDVTFSLKWRDKELTETVHRE
ncbi:MAG TPA: hypothetical protein VMZ06_05480 [Candidatus Bathyarchaeia archaeon]|nr:hypothetical protein [Candidatus Bathyarchaeia archaeon]